MAQVIDRRQMRRNSYHGKRATGYEKARAGRPQWKAEHAAVATMLANASGNVLDCPVGTGRFLALYKKLGLECTGVDVSGEMMAQARAKNLPVKLVKADGRDTGLPAASFDSIVCVRLFCHCTRADMVQLLEEFRRLLRPGGSILASVRFFDERLPDYFTEMQWHAALKDMHLEVREEIDLGDCGRRGGRRAMVRLCHEQVA